MIAAFVKGNNEFLAGIELAAQARAAECLERLVLASTSALVHGVQPARSYSSMCVSCTHAGGPQQLSPAARNLGRQVVVSQQRAA